MSESFVGDSRATPTSSIAFPTQSPSVTPGLLEWSAGRHRRFPQQYQRKNAACFSPPNVLSWFTVLGVAALLRGSDIMQLILTWSVGLASIDK